MLVRTCLCVKFYPLSSNRPLFSFAGVSMLSACIWVSLIYRLTNLICLFSKLICIFVVRLYLIDNFLFFSSSIVIVCEGYLDWSDSSFIISIGLLGNVWCYFCGEIFIVGRVRFVWVWGRCDIILKTQSLGTTERRIKIGRTERCTSSMFYVAWREEQY